MLKPIIHPKTQVEIDNVLGSAPHALGLIGPIGAGKATIANFVASKLLGIDIKKFANHPNTLIIEPENNSIAIDKIRSINQFLRLKTVGKTEIRRIVIIRDAELLRHEAQNALLKLLEEPPTDTVILLTCTNDNSLLPTIYSRIQKIFITRPSKSQIEEFLLNHDIPAKDHSRLLALSDGQIGTLSSLINKSDDHPIIINTETAKKILSSSIFERLAMVDKLAKDKSELSGMLEALERVGRAALYHQVNVGAPIGKLKKTYYMLQSITRAKEHSSYNTHPKLLLTHLFIQF